MNNKIRAWDKAEKKYFYDVTFGDPRLRPPVESRYDFELCMGKKSVQNIEIYEGDILGTRPIENLKAGYGGAIRFGEHQRTFDTIAAEDGDDDLDVNGNCIGFYCTNRCFLDNFFDKLAETYIVGNIHTNPELVNF